MGTRALDPSLPPDRPPSNVKHVSLVSCRTVASFSSALSSTPGIARERKTPGGRWKRGGPVEARARFSPVPPTFRMSKTDASTSKNSATRFAHSTVLASSTNPQRSPPFPPRHGTRTMTVSWVLSPPPSLSRPPPPAPAPHTLTPPPSPLPATQDTNDDCAGIPTVDAGAPLEGALWPQSGSLAAPALAKYQTCCSFYTTYNCNGGGGVPAGEVDCLIKTAHLHPDSDEIQMECPVSPSLNPRHPQP